MRHISYVFLLLAVSISQQNIFCSGEIGSRQTMTNPSRTDGFGAQFQTIIAAVIYAELNNMQYVYTPFKSLEHNYDNDPDFLVKKEWLINFIGNFEVNQQQSLQINELTLIQFFEANLERAMKSDALKKIKTIFRANKIAQNYFGDSHLNIAVHVRRPNIHDSRIDGTNTPDDIFLNVINKLRQLYSLKQPLFHVYSQGSCENFCNYISNDIVLHLNESVEDTFTAMVLADVLVTSASSLSYTAGLLSDGVVYYVPFWHAPLPGWISVDKVLTKYID